MGGYLRLEVLRSVRDARYVVLALAALRAQWGALSATAPRLASDRERGWLDVLAVTPLSAPLPASAWPAILRWQR